MAFWLSVLKTYVHEDPTYACLITKDDSVMKCLEITSQEPGHLFIVSEIGKIKGLLGNGFLGGQVLGGNVILAVGGYAFFGGDGFGAGGKTKKRRVNPRIIRTQQ